MTASTHKEYGMQAKRAFQFREVVTANNLLAVPGDSLRQPAKLGTALQPATKLAFFVPAAARI